MREVQDLHEMRRCSARITLAAGFFDGLHLGHRKVIETAIKSAHATGGEAWVLTFDTHPLKVLNPGSAPLLLTSTPHKLRLIRGCSVDGCVVLTFTRKLAGMSASAFADWLFHCAPSLSEIVIGDNWRFGKGGKGCPNLLANLSGEADVQVTTVRPVLKGSEPISSTKIRLAVMRGQLDAALEMLGRPFSVLGTVVKGHAIGRKIGYPSANLDPHNEALPPLGVYAVRALVGNELHDGVLNFGTRPTFHKSKDPQPTLELHLLDFSDPLYDIDIEAFFVERLRDEWYFSSSEELKSQIALDIAKAREILARKGLTRNQKDSLYTR